MIEVINVLIDSYNVPLITAFLLGVLTSISPCPLATNITAVAYISREIKTAKNTLTHGLLYTLGRATSYTALATLIYFGASSFHIAGVFQGWGDKVLGPVLVLIGLVMFGVLRINIGKGGEKVEALKEWLSQKGFAGSFFLGVLFALAFCPYSGALFFGALIPLILQSAGGLLLSPVFALGTGLPVVVFSFFLAFSVQKMSQAFQVVQKVEKILRYAVATLFIAVGLYYTKFLVLYIQALL